MTQQILRNISTHLTEIRHFIPGPDGYNVSMNLADGFIRRCADESNARNEIRLDFFRLKFDE